MPIHGYPGNVITANPVAPTSTVATGVWTTEQQLKAVAAGNWPLYVPPYQISRSLRFNSADSAYLNRTPASTTNRRTWTWSGWVKRSASSSTNMLLGAFNGFNQGDQRTSLFISSDKLVLETSLMQTAAVFNFETTQVFRDFSAWYHIVAVLDTTQATSTNRIKFYVNGVQVTAFSRTDAPSQNYDAAVNANTSSHFVNRYYDSSAGNFYGDQYLAEIYFIDGQALTPSSFGETNTSTGVWQAKAYSGSYGTNGFYLNFSDNSNTTAATLGKDYSGNGNNWTPNNFSVTAGAGNDSLVDSPASYSPGDTGVGGQVRGNYCTMNPLAKGSTVNIANGNLDVSNSTSGGAGKILGTIGVTSGKWYAEATMSGGGGMPGIAEVTASLSGYPGAEANSWGYNNGGQKYNNGAGTNYGASFTTNDVIGLALDMDVGSITFYKNNVSQGVAYNTGISGKTITFAGRGDTTTTESWNFGQRAFAYTAPSGFQALVTTNLPTPTIGATSTTQANKYFDINLYTGTGSTQSITNSGSMQPDLIWGKQRNGTSSNVLTDAVRGTNSQLSSNSTNAQQTDSDCVTAFNSNGFTVGASTGFNMNQSGSTLVAWQWNAGGSNATNTAGTITSTVRANTTSGFSIVTYTGTGSAATVGHGLGVAPSMVIVKNRSTTTDWLIYHVSLGATKSIAFDTAAAITSSTRWNDTAPTSTLVSIGTSAGVNGSGNSMVAYCFASVAGYSAFGSYTGNGSTDGPFVYLGFRPAFLMIKRTDSTGAWVIIDSKRNTYNPENLELYPNTSAAEANGGTTYIEDFVSNGFKIRQTDATWNASSATYIYAAFAEFPFKFSLAR